MGFNFARMEYYQDEDLYAFLCAYLTDERQALFDKVIKNRTDHFTVAVEDLHKEQNASAVVRSCDCFGIHQLHIIQENNPYKVSKSIAKGAERWVDVKLFQDSAENSQECLDYLRKKGYKIIATTPDPNAQRLDELDIHQPAAFIFGGERDGLSEQIISQADEYLTIPNFGFTESFNISVSAAIILYHASVRLRASKDINWQLSPEQMLSTKIKWAIKTIPRGEKLVKYFYEKVKK